MFFVAATIVIPGVATTHPIHYDCPKFLRVLPTTLVNVALGGTERFGKEEEEEEEEEEVLGNALL